MTDSTPPGPSLPPPPGSPGPGWWLASDGNWYPPQSSPLPPHNPPAPTPPRYAPPPPYAPTPPPFAPAPYYPPWAGPPPQPARRVHGCVWAILAALAVTIVAFVALVIALLVVGHKVRHNFDTSGSLAGPPPPARYTVGQTGRSSGFDFTVHAVKAPFSAPGDYALPTAGYEYVQVDVEVKNTRSSSQEFSSLLAFHLYDADGRSYGEAIVAGIQPTPPDGPIGPAQSVRGFAMFEVPTTATKLRLRCQGSLTASGAVFTLT